MIYVHVTMEVVLNKTGKIEFSVGCMVWLYCRLFQIPRSLKVLIRLDKLEKNLVCFPKLTPSK